MTHIDQLLPTTIRKALLAANNPSLSNPFATIADIGSSGVTTLSAIGATPNTNGATIIGNILNLEPANASFGGVVTTGTQTFAGAKTLTSANLVTPLLGTPTSGVMTNVTGTALGLTAGNVITNANLTGEVTSIGNATTVLNATVIGKTLTGFNVLGSSIVAADTILQAFGKAQNQINNLLGGVMFISTWSASTNTPTLANGIGTKGNYYVASNNGIVNFGAGNIDFNTGDWAIYNGTIWEKVDNTDAVSSVNGFLGAVSLTTANISEVTNLYFTNARAIASTLTGYTSGVGTITSADTILTAIQKLNGNTTTLYVPYTGATTSVNLNAQSLVNVSSLGVGTSTPTLATLQVETSTANQGIRSAVMTTTGSNYALVGIANGIGATVNAGLYVNATGGATNYSIYVENSPVAANRFGLYSLNLNPSVLSGILSVGNITPTNTLRFNQRFDVTSFANGYGGMALTNWASDGTSTFLDFNSSNSNTVGTHVIKANTNVLGAVVFRGSNGTSFANGASIQAVVNGTPSATRMPTDLAFSTSSSIADDVERLRITTDGNVGIGIALPTSVLHLKSGTANIGQLKFNSSTLLATPEVGDVTFSTDSWYGTITTGAARKTFAFLESPILITPNLGTPSAGVMTNVTGVATGLTAGNLSGGLGGQVHYQSAVNTTTMLANGTAGQVLTSAGTTLAPTWATPVGTVTSVTGSGNIASSGGATPNITFTGILPLVNGGTNASLTANNGGIFYSTATAGAILASTPVVGRALISGASAIPSWYIPTTGSVLFAGVGGRLEQANTSLFWDNTNLRLGIGTSAPITTLEVSGLLGGMTLVRTTDAAVEEPFILLKKGVSPLNLCQIRGIFGGGIRFTGGSSSPEWLRISSTGDVGAGTDTPTARLHTKGAGSTSSTFTAKFQNSSNVLSLQIKDNGSVYNLGAGSIATNTAYGDDALIANTTGSSNTAIGFQTLLSNTTGGSNVAIGTQALLNNTTAIQNTAIGVGAMRNNSTGGANVALGFNALFTQTIGTNNTAIGVDALYLNTGGGNVAVGNTALYNNIGTTNTAVGRICLGANTIGNNSVGFGFNALLSNVAGSNGVAIGYQSMQFANSTATPFTNSNTAIGFEAYRGSVTAANNTGNFNTVGGYQTLLNNTSGANNTAWGYQTLLNNSTGSGNTAIGISALLSNTIGTNNSANGRNALQLNTTGSNNVANGFGALGSNTTGITNVAIGFSSLGSNTVAGTNTAVGTSSLNFNTAEGNTAIGNGAGYTNTIGVSITALGNQSLFNNTTGGNNVAAGHGAGYNNTTGGNNTYLGYLTGLGITTGSNNTILGANVTGLLSSLSNNIILADGNGAIRLQFADTGVGTTTNALVQTNGVNNRATENKLLKKDTTDATTVELTTDGAVGVGASNRIAVPANTTLSVVVNICVKQSGSSNSKQMLRQFVIVSNGGVTTIEGAVVTLGTDSGSAALATVTTTITANASGSIRIDVNGLALTNLRFTANVISTEVTYA